ncbi:MAG: LLM class flavin-dependent oxidoreductase [Myxococcales bacterium]|nr:LLM class flavin-dependent oxidoreductase [Myxococcales bacterium]
MSRPHFGVTLPQSKRSWREASDAAREFERLGFDSLWVCDHFFGVPAPQLPILEAWTELTAVAALTERVELGTLVTPPLLRHPAVLAKQVATLDQIAPGRPIIGLGAGWFEAEFKGYGAPFPPVRERLRALEESIEIIRGLYREECFSYVGDVFSVENAYCEPKPETAPRLLIGGGGEQILLRIAAKHADIWNNLAVNQGQLERKVRVLRERCAEIGRDASEITISQQCLVVIDEDDAAAEASLAKAKKIYGEHMGRSLEDHGVWGAPGRVIEGIERHRALGCEHFVIEFFGRDTRLPARLFSEKVLPTFA